MIVKKYPFDKTKLILIAIIAILIGLLSKSCNGSQFTNKETDKEKDSLKIIISKQTQISDSLKLAANKNDSVRIEYITKWRTQIKTIIEHDSIPCDSVLPMVITTCDSIISKDSIYIADLKKIIKSDSIIIKNQNKVIILDSVTISNLQKDLRKIKRQRKWLIGSTGILAGLFILTNS